MTTYGQATHARCNAHVLRELQAVIDHHTHNSGQDVWCWAAQAAGALRTMKHLVDEALARDGTLNSLDTARVADAKHDFRSATRLGARATASQGHQPGKDHNARVPFDNNAAEREIRMVKIRQKVSGSLRTLTGAEQFCAIRSYLATTAEHGLCLLDALTRLTNRHPWLPSTA